MLIFCTARAHCSFLQLEPTCDSMFHPIPHDAPDCPRTGLPTSVQPRKPPECPPIPASLRAVNTISFTNDIDHDAVVRPFVFVVLERGPHRRSLFSRSSPAYTFPPSIGMRLLSRTRPMTLTVANASVCPNTRERRLMNDNCWNRLPARGEIKCV